jgi:hypothetical protein
VSFLSVGLEPVSVSFGVIALVPTDARPPYVHCLRPNLPLAKELVATVQPDACRVIMPLWLDRAAKFKAGKLTRAVC